MGPAYKLRADALMWFSARNPRFRRRDGQPHVTNISFAAGLSPSMLGKVLAEIQPLTTRVEAHLVSLAVNMGATEPEAREFLFTFTGAPGIVVPLVAAA